VKRTFGRVRQDAIPADWTAPAVTRERRKGMKIGIVGLGGVGGCVGARLARRHPPGGEHAVFFLCRGEHGRVTAREGITLVAPEGTFKAAAAGVAEAPVGWGELDLLIFSVKGYDLEGAADTARPACGEKTVILPLLNGVDIADRLKSCLGRGIFLDGTIYCSAFLEGPGVVRQVSPSVQVIFGPRDGVTAPFSDLPGLFEGTGIAVTLTERPREALWQKFLFISAAAGLTALRGMTLGEVVADPEASEMFRGLVMEAQAVARAQGVELPAGIVAETVAKLSAFPPQTKTSLQLDHERGRRTEIETFSGYLVRAGRDLGVPVVLHEKVYRALAGR